VVARVLCEVTRALMQFLRCSGWMLGKTHMHHSGVFCVVARVFLCNC